MDAFTVWADPGGAVADAPFVLCKTVRADCETATTTPAEGKFFCAAMTGIIFFSSAAMCCLRVICHCSGGLKVWSSVYIE
jgi:hypothetical protein